MRRRRAFGTPSRRRPTPNTSETSLAKTVVFEVGQNVYAEYHDESLCKRPEQHKEKGCGGWWYETWVIDKVGPRRLLVSNEFRFWSNYEEMRKWERESQGYISRQFLAQHGWGIAYGPWHAPVASIVLERARPAVEETLGYLLFRKAQLRTLGLTPQDDGNLGRIKEAYRILARKYHPDTGGATASPEEFKRVQAAYDDLTSITDMERLKRILRFMGDLIKERTEA